jgi:hypothetical protein
VTRAIEVSELAVELGEHIDALDVKTRLSEDRTAPSPSTRWQFGAERPLLSADLRPASAGRLDDHH